VPIEAWSRPKFSEEEKWSDAVAMSHLIYRHYGAHYGDEG